MSAAEETNARCVIATAGEGLPCLASIYVLSGLKAPCAVCGPLLDGARVTLSWARQLHSRYYLSDKLTSDQRMELVRLIRAVSQTKPPFKWVIWGDEALFKRELEAVLELVVSAQTTMSIEDYGDALAGAQRRLERLLAELGSHQAQGGEQAEEQEKGGQGV